MLRTLHIASSTKSHCQAACMLFLVVTVALAAMLVRPTLAQRIEKPSVPSAGPAQNAAPDAASPELLSYLPDSFAGAVIVINVEAIIQSPSIAPTIAQLPPEARNFAMPNVQLPLDDLQTLMAIVPNTLDSNQALVVVRFKPGKALPQ